MKLDDRCQKGIFVGYDRSSPAYLVYYPEHNKIMKHRCVKFTEKFAHEIKSKPKSVEMDGDDENFPGRIYEKVEETPVEVPRNAPPVVEIVDDDPHIAPADAEGVINPVEPENVASAAPRRGNRTRQ